MIRKAEQKDIHILTEFTLLLWPHHTADEMKEELAEILAREDGAFFLAYDGRRAVGFAQCQLRHDYVEGTDSTPVGYLEGIYVEEGFRKKGIARELLSACESWAKGKGCREFASDCELDNVQSLQFHLRVGFGEANRIICFTKEL